MADLKMVDELLCLMKQQNNLTWAELERFTNTSHQAMQRLRQAWKNGEMEIITLGLANYFEETDGKGPYQETTQGEQSDNVHRNRSGDERGDSNDSGIEDRSLSDASHGTRHMENVPRSTEQGIEHRHD